MVRLVPHLIGTRKALIFLASRLRLQP